MKKVFYICLPQIKNKIKFKRHINIALFVGTILNLINQYNSLVSLDFNRFDIPKAAITYCVPFLVSVYSAATFNSEEVNK